MLGLRVDLVNYIVIVVSCYYENKVFWEDWGLGLG